MATALSVRHHGAAEPTAALNPSSADETTLVDWLQLIRAEYLEIPGLNLTKPQVQRLWNLDPVLCDALLDALTDVKFLRRTHGGAYVRADLGH